MRQVMRPLVMPLVLLSAACQTIVETPPASCREYIPGAWAEGVAGAPLPSEDTARTWQSFGVAQSGQLEKANGRLVDVLHIIAVCERNVNEARPREKFLGIF